MSARSYLSIGDVLTLLRQEFPDVTISKIRFLESQGLVNPERTPSGYRKFYEHDVERLRWVLRQQREHFLPLKVIRDRLDDDPGGPEAAEPRPRRADVRVAAADRRRSGRPTGGHADSRGARIDRDQADGRCSVGRTIVRRARSAGRRFPGSSRSLGSATGWPRRQRRRRRVGRTDRRPEPAGAAASGRHASRRVRPKPHRGPGVPARRRRRHPSGGVGRRGRAPATRPGRIGGAPVAGPSVG